MKSFRPLISLTCIATSVLACTTAAPAAAADAPTSAPAGATPKSPTLEFLFEELVTLGEDIKVGETPKGQRNITPITGGTFKGPKLSGRILPGGWDWQLIGKQCLWLEANYFIQTNDGTTINIINKGPWCSHDGKDDPMTLTTPVFEAPLGKYEWLNYGAYVGTAEDLSTPGHPMVRIRFFRAVL